MCRIYQNQYYKETDNILMEKLNAEQESSSIETGSL